MCETLWPCVFSGLAKTLLCLYLGKYFLKSFNIGFQFLQYVGGDNTLGECDRYTIDKRNLLQGFRGGSLVSTPGDCSAP